MGQPLEARATNPYRIAVAEKRLHKSLLRVQVLGLAAELKEGGIEDVRVYEANRLSAWEIRWGAKENPYPSSVSRTEWISHRVSIADFGGNHQMIGYTAGERVCELVKESEDGKRLSIGQRLRRAAKASIPVDDNIYQLETALQVDGVRVKRIF